MKKFLSLVCVLALALTCVSAALAEEMFPLKEPVTFTIDVMTAKDTDQLGNSPYYRELVERTGVSLKLVSLGADWDTARSKLSLLYSSGDYGDAIWGGSLIAEADYSQLAAANILVSLKPYIEDPAIMPNFNNQVLSESPNTKAFITAPDGEIYSMPSYNKLSGAYLESPFCVNAEWLQALNLEVPTTIEEFKAMLIAFRDGDPNGNGIKDEIPFIFLEGNAQQHMEALLGLWGLATKDSTLDNFVMVQDGKVIFVPVQEGYKAAVNELGDWFKEGLIWSEAFVSNNETLFAKRDSDPPVVGVVTIYGFGSYGIDHPDANAYMQILPPVVEGYERCWYFHPGWQGIKSKFSLTTKCQQPEVLMHYFDILYDIHENYRFSSGDPEDGRYEIVDGRYSSIKLTDEENEKLNQTVPTFASFITDALLCRTTEYYRDYAVADNLDTMVRTAAYDRYSEAGIINDEIWPRPYMSDDDSVRLGELRTDIFNIVNEKRAQWVTGAADVNAEWDAYVSQLNALGLDEFVSILQGAYDTYLENMK